MKPGSIIFSALFLLWGNLLYVTAQSGKDSIQEKADRNVRVYNTQHLSGKAPVIDGVLDDTCWQQGSWAGEYTQWIPNEGAPPSQPTFLKVLYDDKNVYVAIRAVDYEPDKISRKAARRDEMAGDVVGICFDSYFDHRTGFEFDVTASGQRIDMLLTNPMNGDPNWNAVWKAKTGMEDSAWTVEMEIPLSQLRYSTAKKQVWGMHSWRWIDRLQEESDWEPQTSTGPGMLYLFGELHGINSLPKSRRIEIMPYALGKMNTFKKETGNPFAEDGRNWLGNAGLDAKIGLTSNFTADLTINPDFGQVESDPSVMNLTAFETFFEEKRPFFLEGKNIFSFDYNNSSLFYSRRIGHAPSYSPDIKDTQYIQTPENTPILGAVKLSGKTAEGLSVGVLESLTANTFAKISTNGITSNTLVEPMTNYTIARVQQDINEGNTVVGGIFTATNRYIDKPELNFLSNAAYTGGIDVLHHWHDKEFFVDAKFTGSTVEGSSQAMINLQRSSARYYQRPDINYVSLDSTLNRLSGYGGSLKIGKGSKGLWRYSTELNWNSPGLELNDLGYMQMADAIDQSNEVSYFVNHPVSIFRTYNVGIGQNNGFDFGGRNTYSEADIWAYMEFTNKWALNASSAYTLESLDTRKLRGGPAMLLPAQWNHSFYVRTDPSKNIFFNVSSNLSNAGNNSKKSWSVHPGFTTTPSSIFKFSVHFDYEDNLNTLQYVDTRTEGNAHEYILGSIDQQTLGLTFRLDYYITPEISLQYYGSPFASTGKYSDFKKVTDPKADNYTGRFAKLQTVRNENQYDVVDGSGITTWSFDNPDFNFAQFRSNLVFRWEYRPGSQFYFVWSQDRTLYEGSAYGPLGDAMHGLTHTFPDNIFLVKFNYWFSL